MARAYERHKVFTNSKLKVELYGMVNLAQPWFLRTSFQFYITFNELSNVCFRFKRSKYEIMENYQIFYTSVTYWYTGNTDKSVNSVKLLV
jgi:hypothetical protein